MSYLSPKPVISQVIRSECAPLGMTFSLAQDVEQNVWIIEACPVGTQFWSVDQASSLPIGYRSGKSLSRMVAEGRKLEREQRLSKSRSLDSLFLIADYEPVLLDDETRTIDSSLSGNHGKLANSNRFEKRSLVGV